MITGRGELHGREYEVHAPTIKHEWDRRKAVHRVHVKGMNKANGLPIRFKSVGHADRHMRNVLRIY